MFKDLELVSLIATLTLESREEQMCQTRQWLRLYSEETTKNTDGSMSSFLIGERSDYETFKVEVRFTTEDSITEIANKVKKAHETLEGYRNCDCTARLGECIKHLSTMQLPINHPKGVILNFGSTR